MYVEPGHALALQGYMNDFCLFFDFVELFSINFIFRKKCPRFHLSFYNNFDCVIMLL